MVDTHDDFSLPASTMCKSSSTVATLESDGSSSDLSSIEDQVDRRVHLTKSSSTSKVGKQEKRIKSGISAPRSRTGHLRKTKSVPSSIVATKNVDSKGKVSSKKNKSVNDNRPQLRKTRSCLVLPSSETKKSNRRGQLRKAKSVSFNCNKDGKVQHHERKFTPSTDKSLWWNSEEIRMIRVACFDIVQRAKTSKISNFGDTGELRGLEQYIITAPVNTVDLYRSLVLEAQRNPSFYNDIVTQDAVNLSRAAQRKAQRTAKYDTTEALKAALTKWEDKVYVID